MANRNEEGQFSAALGIKPLGVLAGMAAEFILFIGAPT